ncbi:unnamed protein product [Blepharisma stoltei]|uniref:Uncharacterized protein n=1 Tax=Blepharisma stoltei TaxID=1481888 RepID=A0AAU9ISK3_9CILI|nr:unnamed protein product [Blepharisma stoltei]
MADCGVIIGASRGIGKDLTLRLATQYPDLPIIAISSSIASSPAAAEFSQTHRNISCFDADMSTTEGVSSVASHIQGKIRFLVYASAIPGPMWSENPTPEDFDTVMNINTRSVFFLARGLSDKFAEGSKFLIVNAGLAHVYLIPFPLYSISKAALYMTYQVLKQEIKTTAVGSVLPGVVKTHISDTVFEKMQTDLNIKRLQPEIVAKFLAYLISDKVSSERFSHAEWDIYNQDHQFEWLEEGDEPAVMPSFHK